MGFKDFDIENIGLKASFIYADMSDPLDKVFVKKTGDTVNSSVLNVGLNDTEELSVMARTETGFVVDMSNVQVSFISDNTSIATVNTSGVITGVSSGIAKITASVTKDNVTKSTDIYVSVNDTLSSVVTECAMATIAVDKTTELKSTGYTTLGRILPITDTATYTSSNPSVATVDANGVVTGISVGNATITISETYGGVTQQDTIVIYVVSAVLESITLTTDVDVLKIGQTCQLSVTGIMSDGSPADLTNATIVYSSDNRASIDINGKFTAVSEGIVDAMVTVTLDGVGKQTRIPIKIYGDIAPSLPFYIQNYNSGGDASYNSSTDSYWLVSNGANVWTSPDMTTNVLRTVSNSDPLTVAVKVNNLFNTHKDASTGIMIRDSNIDNSKMVNLRVIPGGGIRFVYRTTDGGSPSYVSGPEVSFPVELKVERLGDTFTGYYKDSFGQWVSVGSCNIIMSGDVEAGINLFSVDTANYTIAEFKNLTITGATVAPVIIDVDSSGYSESSGAVWYDSGLMGYDGTRTRYSGTSGAYATWTPANLPAGMYKVYIYKVVHSTCDTNAKIDVVHNGTTDTTFIDYTSGVSEWVELGTYYFSGAGGEYVQNTHSGNYIRTNAVKFELQ